MAIQIKQFNIPDIPTFDMYDGDNITKNLSLNIDIPIKDIKSLKIAMKINLIDNALKGNIEFQFGNTNVDSLTIPTTGNVVRDYTKNVELADIQPNYPVKVIAHNLRWNVVAVSITDIMGEVTYNETLPQTSGSINIGNVAVNNIYLGVEEINKVYIGDIVVYSKGTIVTDLKPVLAWEFTGHTNNVNSVAVDNQNNVYTGGHDNIVRKIKQE